MAVVERGQLAARVLGTLEQLVVGRDAVAALRVGDAVELGLHRLDTVGLGLERGEEAVQVGRRLAQLELRRAQRLARRGKLRREPFERRDGALGSGDEIGSAVAVVGRERRDGRCGAGGELGDVAEPLAVGAQLVLGAGLEALGVGHERAQPVEPCLRGRGVAGQLVVQAPCRRQLAPGTPRLTDGLTCPGEGVEHRQLVRGPGQPPLLELAAHREQALDRCRHVLARGAAAPRVGARAPVGEDPACDDERLLALGPQLGELAQRVGIGQVELGLDVRLAPGRPDRGGVAARPEQQADRAREDRLARARLAGDRVEPLVEGELGLADEDEVLDAEAAQHSVNRTAAIRLRRLSEKESAGADGPPTRCRRRCRSGGRTSARAASRACCAPGRGACAPSRRARACRPGGRPRARPRRCRARSS